MFLQLQVWAFMLLQEAGSPQWDFRHLWGNMGSLARAVVIVMFLMSAWSIGVMIDRLMAFNAARKQSRAFAPAVAGALRETVVRDHGKGSGLHQTSIGRFCPGDHRVRR